MNRVGVTTDQWMPVVQGLSLPKQSISAGQRHPIGVGVKVVGFQHDTIGHKLVTIDIVGTAAGRIVQATS